MGIFENTDIVLNDFSKWNFLRGIVSNHYFIQLIEYLVSHSEDMAVYAGLLRGPCSHCIYMLV